MCVCGVRLFYLFCCYCRRCCSIEHKTRAMRDMVFDIKYITVAYKWTIIENRLRCVRIRTMKNGCSVDKDMYMHHTCVYVAHNGRNGQVCNINNED